MLYVSARERKIIELLLSKHQEATVKQISDTLEVSMRTIHRDLQGVFKILKTYNLKLDKKTGSGIRVIGDQENKQNLLSSLTGVVPNEYTVEERQIAILTLLLEKREPVKLIALANDLKVTIATISNELLFIEEMLESYGLFLTRKRGSGVMIQGPEPAKRKIIRHLLFNHLNEFEFIRMIRTSIEKKSKGTLDVISSRLLGLIDTQKLYLIEKKLSQLTHDLTYPIADISYVGLIVHLALAVERIQQKEEIHIDAKTLAQLSNLKEFEIAKKIISELEVLFHISIPLGEIGYITMHLLGAKVRNEQELFFEDSTIQIGALVNHLLKKVSQKVNCDLTKINSLIQGLVSHLKPALYRIEQNMGILNPLLPQIQNDFKELFSIVEESVKFVFPTITVPPEEIGYLVMHIASALYHQNEPYEFKAIVVCSSGIGTSKILSTRLEHEIPGLKTCNLSLFELESIDTIDYDVIISTIPLTEFEKDYILVSPLPSQEELEQVRRCCVLKNQFIRYPAEKKMNPLNRNSFCLAPKFTAENFVQLIEHKMYYSTAIYHVLQGFTVSTDPFILTMEEALFHTCRKLNLRGVITSIDAVLERLRQRESLGGLGIPGTQLALYHTTSEQVNHPSFTIFRFAQPVFLKAMDGRITKISTLLLLLSPHCPHEITREVLSTISSLLIRDEETTSAFESDSEATLQLLLATELNTLFEIKTRLLMKEH